jgi:hypothetical protein
LQNCRAWWKFLQADAQGVTLVEFLLGSAITVIITLMGTSMLLANQSSRRVLQQQTDRYESVRLVADAMIQDARFATWVDCPWGDVVRLFSKTTFPQDYVIYQFADSAGNPDPVNIHRVVVVGGVVQRDDIVGWDLLSDPWGGATNYTCTSGFTSRKVDVQLFKAGHQSTSPNIILEYTIFVRT